MTRLNDSPGVAGHHAVSDTPRSGRQAAARIDFGLFYQKTVAPLRRYLARLLGNRDKAKDLAHDAFLRVHGVMAERQITEPKAYLFTTARRLAVDEIRRRSSDPLLRSLSNDSLAALQSETPGTDRIVMARQELEQLLQDIDSLPPGCRSVFLLSRLDNLSHGAIAQKLGIAYSTVEKQHARAIRLLRKTIRANDAKRSLP